MGFESSRVARRRLASLAASNESVQAALSPSSFPGLFAGENGVFPGLRIEAPADLVDTSQCHDRVAERIPAVEGDSHPTAAPTLLVQQLDELAQDIASTPGAGGALLAAYAAQARALSMVIEAAKRGQSSPLPSAVLMAAQAALVPPQVLSGLAFI